MALDAICKGLNKTRVSPAPPESRADCGPVIWESGIVQMNNELVGFANSDSKSFEHEFLLPMEITDFMTPVMCVDDATGVNPNGIAPSPCDCATACSSSYRGTRQLAAICKSLGDMQKYCSSQAMELADYITDHLASEAWVRAWEAQVLAVLDAITADNLANDAGDMIIDITGEAGTDALFNCDVHIDALSQLGCPAAGYSGILMHRDVFMSNLMKREKECCGQEVYQSELIARSPLLRGEGDAAILTYQGLPVYVTTDSRLKDVTDPLNPIYKTYYYGRGLFQFGLGDLRNFDIMPFETDRTPCDNGGMGTTKMYSRQTWVLVPKGFTNLWSPDCNGPNDFAAMKNTEASDPANWDRVMDRRNIPLTIVCSAG